MLTLGLPSGSRQRKAGMLLAFCFLTLRLCRLHSRADLPSPVSPLWKHPVTHSVCVPYKLFGEVNGETRRPQRAPSSRPPCKQKALFSTHQGSSNLKSSFPWIPSVSYRSLSLPLSHFLPILSSEEISQTAASLSTGLLTMRFLLLSPIYPIYRQPHHGPPQLKPPEQTG